MSTAAGIFCLITDSQYLEQPYVYESVMLNTSTDTLTVIPGFADCFMIDCIIIPIEFDLSLITELKIDIEDIYSQSIPFQIIRRVSRIKQTLTHYMIYIPKDLFVDNPKSWGYPYFRFPGSSYATINICTTEAENQTKISIGLQWCFLDNKLRCINIDYTGYESHLIEGWKKFHSRKITGMEMIIGHNGSCNGMFVGLNEKLKSVALYGHGIAITAYNEMMLDYAATTIHKWDFNDDKSAHEHFAKLMPTDLVNVINTYAQTQREYIYWIPFLGRTNWNSTHTQGSYVNTGRMDANSVKIKFDKKYEGSICLVSVIGYGLDLETKSWNQIKKFKPQ